MPKTIDGLLLFSGGLDSILAARLLLAQGLNIVGLHYVSPFFGQPQSVKRWESMHNLQIRHIDISEAFAEMLAGWPPHGPGKTLNPCVDCKILMLRDAARLMREWGAKFIATGEVLGQRPMSQRAETMNIIIKSAELQGLLLRPLCARLLAPTRAEEQGIVNRDTLGSISGRGRLAQLEMAKQFSIEDIPAPGGGCKLTERENARRYWPLIQRYRASGGRSVSDLVNDFRTADLGRTFFHAHTPAWLCIGRKKADNDALQANRLPGDKLLRLPFPGPLALLRGCKEKKHIEDAAALLASFSPRARAMTGAIAVRAIDGHGVQTIQCQPASNPDWTLPSWIEIHDSIKEERRAHI